MPDGVKESGEIKETDIVFDCPKCSKSLAIDYRGAGLTIPCTDCGADVEVPIPEGMELTDFDSSEEEQEIRILNLRRSLSSSEEQIDALQAQVDALSAENSLLKKQALDSGQKLKAILEHVSHIAHGEDAVRRALEKIDEVMKDADAS